MKNIEISHLFTYPLKSAKGISLQSTEVTPSGFTFDRCFAVMNSQNVIITARENPILLSISCVSTHTTLSFSHPSQNDCIVAIETLQNTTPVTLFKKETSGKSFTNTAINQWLSEVLQENCTLITINPTQLRTVQHNTSNSAINFSDAYPLHLINEASVKNLQKKLDQPITPFRFRANIIIKGCPAYEEENWQHIRIGNCSFEIVCPTKRCSLITINPNTLQKSNTQEPLRSIAQHKPNSKGAYFGMYLLPKTTGTLHKSDTISVL